MTNKDLTMGKGWLHYEGVGFSFSALVEKFRTAVKLNVPVGYQDETGFHFGEEPVRKEVKFPSDC